MRSFKLDSKLISESGLAAGAATSVAMSDTRNNVSTASLLISDGEVPRFWWMAFAAFC